MGELQGRSETEIRLKQFPAPTANPETVIFASSLNVKTMCLYTTQRRADKAKKPITCYKVVKHWYNIPVFTSMYQHFEYKPGTLRREKRFKCMPRKSGAVYFGFHSYSTLRCARSSALSKDVILKCEIPVDSRYYTSNTGEEYCSNRIRIIAWRKASEKKWHQ